ncbi:MAG: deoxyribose-phosphate aldolase, partial [Flavobacteriaceae bacterium]|nr:deoxyribose-phosphate aldolase [Flavobacteriaceae bacterium]
MKKILLSLLILTSFVACKEKPQPLTVQQIVDQAIEKAGGDLYEKAHIEFDFRKIHYLSTRQGSKYSYERVQTDSTGRK